MKDFSLSDFDSNIDRIVVLLLRIYLGNNSVLFDSFNRILRFIHHFTANCCFGKFVVYLERDIR